MSHHHINTSVTEEQSSSLRMLEWCSSCNYTPPPPSPSAAELLCTHCWSPPPIIDNYGVPGFASSDAGVLQEELQMGMAELRTSHSNEEDLDQFLDFLLADQQQLIQPARSPPTIDATALTSTQYYTTVDEPFNIDALLLDGGSGCVSASTDLDVGGDINYRDGPADEEGTSNVDHANIHDNNVKDEEHVRSRTMAAAAAEESCEQGPGSSSRSSSWERNECDNHMCVEDWNSSKRKRWMSVGADAEDEGSRPPSRGSLLIVRDPESEESRGRGSEEGAAVLAAALTTGVVGEEEDEDEWTTVGGGSRDVDVGWLTLVRSWTAGAAAKKGGGREEERRYERKVRSEEEAVNDGYRWRKYGQKKIKGHAFPRGYYKCSASNCDVKKQVEKCDEDGGFRVTYEGIHLHYRPFTPFLKSNYKQEDSQVYKSPTTILNMSSICSTSCSSSSMGCMFNPIVVNKDATQLSKLISS